MTRVIIDKCARRRTIARFLVATAISVILVYWVYAVVGWVGVKDLVLSVRPTTLLVVVPGIVLSHILRALRLVLCYRDLSNSIRDIAGIGIIHNCLNYWLPMRMGELVLPVLSRSRLGIGYTESIVTLVYIRVLDVHVLLMLVVFFVGDTLLAKHYYWLSLGCLASLPVLLFSIRVLPVRSRIVRRVDEIVGHAGYWLATYLVTLGVWVSKIGALGYLARAISDIEFNHAWVATIVADASSMSPITGLANAGTFEAGFVLPLMLFGYDQGATLGVAVALHLVLGVVSLLMGVAGIVMLYNRLQRTPQGPVA